MKCALEILAERAIAEEKYQEEQARLDELCRMAYSKIAENSIKFCETRVNEDLENKARKRYSLVCDYQGVFEKDRLGNTVFYLLKDDPNFVYANGDPSYVPDRSMGYDPQIIADYLKQFCIESRTFESTFKMFGSGVCRGVTLQVFISNPPCV